MPLQYTVSIEDRGPDLYAPEHVPHGKGRAGLWLSAVLRGASGKHYFATRDNEFSQVRIAVGDSTVELAQHLYGESPAHSFGEVVSCSGGTRVTSSWTLVERLPDMPVELLGQLLEAFSEAQLSERSRKAP